MIKCTESKCTFETSRPDSLLRHQRLKHGLHRKDFKAVRNTLADGGKWTWCGKTFTVKSESIHSVGFGFSSISPSNLGQISKSGTVLKSWECVDFKTVPDFGIWPRFDREIEEKPDPTLQIGFNFAVD